VPTDRQDIFAHPHPFRRFGGRLAALVPRRHGKPAGHPAPRRAWPRYTAAVAVAAVAAVAAAGCSSAGPGDSNGTGGSGGSGSSRGTAGETAVTIALPVAEPVQSPVYLASKLGYFSKEGINAHVVVLASDTAADAALVAGSVQFTSVNAVALITAAEKGVPLQDICTEYNGPSWALAVSSSVLSSTHVTASTPLKQLLTALHGTKVAIVGTAASAPGLILTGLLQQEGLPANWLDLIGVEASSDLSSAYSHGEVAAVFDTQPTPDEIVQNFSGKVVFNTAQLTALDQIPWEGLVGNKSYISGNAKVDKAVCAAIGEADNYILKNPSAAASELSGTFPSLSPALLKDSLLAYKWAPNAGMTTAQWTSSASLLVKFGLISKVPPSTLSGVYSTSYLPAG
jgi:ABC-type nitrate/sulfonate/bicarbonate transport system substrate-binding protein